MTLEDLGLALVAFGLTRKEARNFTRKLNDRLQWQAARDYAGYGSFGYQGKTWKSHRLVYAATHPGEDITGIFVVQSCADLICCDPECLHTQVNKPMRCDPEEYQGKLHAKTVERLRRMPFDDTNKCELARNLGVSPSTVRKAMQSLTHKRVKCTNPSTSDAGSIRSTSSTQKTETASPTTTSRAGATFAAARWSVPISRTSVITSVTAVPAKIK